MKEHYITARRQDGEVWPYLGHGVVVDIDDFIEVFCDDPGHIEQSVEIIFPIGDEAIESNGGQVAHSHFSRISVLDDLSTQVA